MLDLGQFRLAEIELAEVEIGRSRSRSITWTHYRWGVRSDRIMAYTDSDRAANREDRRSVSGGMLSGQKSRERCRFRRGKVSYTLLYQLEWRLSVSKVDSDCVSIACDNQGVVDHTARQGLGLAKHVHTRHRWLQAARDEGLMDVVKISKERNPADLLTKPLPFSRIEELCRLVGVEYDDCTLAQSSEFTEPLKPCITKSPTASRRILILLPPRTVSNALGAARILRGNCPSRKSSAGHRYCCGCAV